MAARPAPWIGDCIRDLLPPCGKRPLLLWRVDRDLPCGLRGHVLGQIPIPTVEKELLEGEDAGECARPHSPPEIREGRNHEGTVPADDEGSTRGSPASAGSATDLTWNAASLGGSDRYEPYPFESRQLPGGHLLALIEAGQSASHLTEARIEELLKHPQFRLCLEHYISTRADISSPLLGRYPRPP
jgi:hypothetical protein